MDAKAQLKRVSGVLRFEGGLGMVGGTLGGVLMGLKTFYRFLKGILWGFRACWEGSERAKMDLGVLRRSEGAGMVYDVLGGVLVTLKRF